VFGFIKKGKIDQRAIKTLLKVTGNKETVFHMAFDELLDQQKGIDILVNLGITRILTKGGHGTAMENLDKLKSLHEYANGRIQLIAGGSVNDDNYQTIAQTTGIKYFHGRKLAHHA
jgi:copper homeostasis protein